MMASSTAVALSEGELRQRSQPASSQEEKLIERLDAFLSLIESRLDNFDQFFRFQQQETAAKEAAAKAEPVAPLLLVPTTPLHSRRGLALLMLSIKQFSMNNLNNVYTRLRLIKKQVLLNLFTNLDYLYNTLAQQYDLIFNEDLGEFVLVAKGALRELLSEKIITTIQYFDEKLLAIDDFIKPHASSDYSAAVEYNHLRFFNFNKALKEAVNKRIHYYQLPLLWRENKYIVYGYRFSLSHWTMAKSVLQVNHNEFVNIWTHFIGFLVMAYLQFVHFPLTAVYAANSWTDNAFWCLFFFAAYQCLLGSCVWHTYLTFAHYPTRANCACIDYTGITVLITNLVLLAEYALLYHHPKLMRAIGGFSVTCGLAGFAFNWLLYFDRPECRLLRIGFFIGLAALGVLAMLCQAFYQGVFSAARFHFPLVWKLFVWYLGGTVFYGGLFPERWRYDVVFPDDGTHCHHEYDALDVLTDKVGHDGEEELEQLEDDLQRTETESQFDALVQKYFPAEPKKTPYANDFMSLWWVDYIGSSHNIWHVCVVLGVVGHYFGMLDLFSQVSR